MEDYTVREGEFLCGPITGWNFGDGHFHGKQLLDAVQEQCQYKPGELRIITLESQPIHLQRQQHKIYDAATGLVEEGYVEVKDMIERQPAVARSRLRLPGARHRWRRPAGADPGPAAAAGTARAAEGSHARLTFRPALRMDPSPSRGRGRPGITAFEERLAERNQPRALRAGAGGAWGWQGTGAT